MKDHVSFLVDSHCHLDLLDLTADGGQLDAVLARAKAAGVSHLLNVSVSLAQFATVLQTAERYPFVSASLGSHPNEQDEVVDVEQLIMLGQHKKVVAIGETGLDYFRTRDDHRLQQQRFAAHISAAKTLKKPLIVHTRDAKDDTIELMQREQADQVGGVMHCFTEEWAIAKKALDMNFYISFSGIVTFNNAATIQAVAKQVPLDKMLIETDAPYLAPHPFRGKPNEPSYVRYTAEYIAALRGISFEALATATTQNFFTLFAGAKTAHV